MTSAFSWQNSISLCPASFRTSRPNLPVTPGVSWLPTFAFQSTIGQCGQSKWETRKYLFGHEKTKLACSLVWLLKIKSKWFILCDHFYPSEWKSVCCVRLSVTTWTAVALLSMYLWAIMLQFWGTFFSRRCLKDRNHFSDIETNCQIILQNMWFIVCVLVTQSCSTFCDPLGCSPPGSSFHGILQAKILEWVAIPFSRGSSQPGMGLGSPALQTDSSVSVPPRKPELIYTAQY